MQEHVQCLHIVFTATIGATLKGSSARPDPLLPPPCTVPPTVLLPREWVGGCVLLGFVSVCEFNTLWMSHVSLASWGADDVRWAGVNSSKLLSHDALNVMMVGGSEMENTHGIARIISYIPLAQLRVELAADGKVLPSKWGQK